MTASIGAAPATVSHTELRARFAARLSALYGSEVPAYNALLDVSHQVNDRVVRRVGPAAQRLGSIDRITAERHGAIRVGSPREMAQVARIFAAVGMHPCGFYDLRDAYPSPVPVVSTAFRPLDRDELTINPFRVFTSVLVPEDRRFFKSELAQRLVTFIEARRLFPEELLALADRSVLEGHLSDTAADRFLELATAAFALSRQPVDHAWYTELERISSVAADIGGVTTTHINHLTPRVLDIDDLYTSMQATGIEMIERIEGPPRWDGPDVLLRQTSFRALAEPRDFREPDGRVVKGSLRVRFGEVEARGIALTPVGRGLYEQMMRTIDERMIGHHDLDRQTVAQGVWEKNLPKTEQELCLQALGYFTYRVDDIALQRSLEAGTRPPATSALEALVRQGVVVPEPIVYEDFLPRSAAGIFASNLTSSASRADGEGGAARTIGWMSAIVEAEVRVPEEVYAEESNRSLAIVENILASRRRGVGDLKADGSKSDERHSCGGLSSHQRRR